MSFCPICGGSDPQLQAHIICMRNLIQRRDATITRATELSRRVAKAEPMAAAGQRLRDFMWNEMQWHGLCGKFAGAVSEYDSSVKAADPERKRSKDPVMLSTDEDVDAHFGEGSIMSGETKWAIRYVAAMPPVRKVKVGR